MPHRHTHSRPPSWSTLFPYSTDHPPEWKLPKYSPRSGDEKPSHGWVDEHTAASPTPGVEHFWHRYGKLVAAVLATTTLVSTMFTAMLLLSQPDSLQLVKEFLPATHSLGESSLPLPTATDASETEIFEQPETIMSEEVEYKAYIGQFLMDAPGESFEDNLRSEHQYITSWPSAGWTNDVMTYANLIHLALLTSRIPILPPFAPSHLPQEAGFPPVGEVFDIPRLSKAIGIPILEWKDVKRQDSDDWEVLGCWSTWSTWQDSHRPSYVLPRLKLDVSYTGLPDDFKLFHDNPNDYHVSLNKLVQLAFPSGRNAALVQHQPVAAQRSGLTIEPSEHLLCYDYLYYTGVDTAFEWWYDWSPQWRFVGTHMHWTPRVEGIAKEYLMNHFGTNDVDSVPPYIVVHARRGDFLGQCATQDMTCLPTHSQMKRRVLEMQSSLAAQGIQTDRVLVTSDETDPTWWEAITEMGYTYINHTELGTEAKYGMWYGPILDAAFQSMGAAVIGTERSTMSLLAERRALDWQSAPSTRLTFSNVPGEDN
ncbi:hypothetical protein CALCODRAFT_138136 [Calocera cornea HHB12733]|uniref:Uncharacterized protein n=1 Tax=Calocera cornea HHB12733 TaxID=1353952 RepID=A0A165CT39_9BASI|nr:hypothetical protein CALCODRAFT_138136 [Calocera cornea HHB12733]